MKIETTCGKTFEMSPREMSDSQLDALLRQNSNRTDTNPDEIVAVREELARRHNIRR